MFGHSEAKGRSKSNLPQVRLLIKYPQFFVSNLIRIVVGLKLKLEKKVLTCLTTKISGSLIWKGIVFYNKKLQNEKGNANKGKFGATFSPNRYSAIGYGS